MDYTEINLEEKVKEMAHQVIITMTPAQKESLRKLCDYLKGEVDNCED